MLTVEDLAPSEIVAMGYCCDRGIPVSLFLGRVVGFGEPQWTERDAQIAVLWLQEKNSLCPGCNRPSSETTVPVDQAPEYEVTAKRCWSCRAREAKLDEFRDNSDASATWGLLLSVVPKAD